MTKGASLTSGHFTQDRLSSWAQAVKRRRALWRGVLSGTLEQPNGRNRWKEQEGASGPSPQGTSDYTQAQEHLGCSAV